MSQLTGKDVRFDPAYANLAPGEEVDVPGYTHVVMRKPIEWKYSDTRCAAGTHRILGDATVRRGYGPGYKYNPENLWLDVRVPGGSFSLRATDYLTN